MLELHATHRTCCARCAVLQAGVLRALAEARLAARGGLSEGIVKAATHAYKTLSAAAKAQFALLGER